MLNESGLNKSSLNMLASSRTPHFSSSARLTKQAKEFVQAPLI